MPLPDGFLERFRAAVFVETGSHRGDGIAAAIRVGFEAIFSVDVSPFAFGWCCHRFERLRTQVHLYCGDSAEFLAKTIGPILTTPVVFWLDAHWCGGEGEMDGREGGTRADVPLLRELAVISSFPITTHTILIDDVNHFGVEPEFPTKDQVVSMLQKINPHYRIYTDQSAPTIVAAVP